MADGVAAAAPRVSTKGAGGTNRILGTFGYALGTDFGPGTIFENWIEDPELTPYRIVEGRAPEADDEVVLNEAALEDDHLGAQIAGELRGRARVLDDADVDAAVVVELVAHLLERRMKLGNALGRDVDAVAEHARPVDLQA